MGWDGRLSPFDGLLRAPYGANNNYQLDKLIGDDTKESHPDRFTEHCWNVENRLFVVCCLLLLKFESHPDWCTEHSWNVEDMSFSVDVFTT